MHGKTRMRIAVLIAFLTAVTLGTLGSSGIARAAQSAQAAAPAISSGNCTQSFFLDNRFNGGLDDYGIIKSGDLYFDVQNGGGTEFCQAIVPGTTNVVVIYEDGTNECLALNASLNLIYLHGASGCDGTLPYTEWIFQNLKIGAGNVYALQLQYNYQGLGVNKPCLYAGSTSTTVASVTSCSSEGSDEFLQYIYDRV